jgi:hypothetical protein
MLRQRKWKENFNNTMSPNDLIRRFNRELMQKRGEGLGAEFKGKGVHVALGEFCCHAYITGH